MRTGSASSPRPGPGGHRRPDMNARAARVVGDGPLPERRAWSFPLDLDGYDRQGQLTAAELRALLELGPAYLRRSRARGADQRTPRWDALTRLVAPLDEARAVLHHAPTARYRRAGAHAAGLVLQHCAETGRAYWGWTAPDWATLCCPSAEEFLAARTLPTEITVRPFLVALGYLLGGFTDAQQLGTFNRLHLAQLVFGADRVEDSMRRAVEILDGWGYRGVLTAQHRWRGMFAQALLINRSPRLEDLTTEAFRQLLPQPANAEPHGAMLFALQRAVAALRHCDPPVRTGANAVPVIEGADPSWIGWVQRWYDTSTLTPKVRATIRTLMAKAGRWLATEHPEITEPAQWTRQTCAAWSLPWTACGSAITSSAAMRSAAAAAARSRRAPRRMC